MVGGVKILSIPARREEDIGTDASSASSLGELDGIERASTRVRVCVVGAEVGTKAAPGNGASSSAVGVPMSVVTDHGVPDDHTEALECVYRSELTTLYLYDMRMNSPWGRR